jgi:recombination protein RecA
VVKNKVAPPFRKVELEILFGKGISAAGSLLDGAVKHGIIDKKGAWYSCGEEKIGQGRESARDYLIQYPAFAADVEDKLRKIIFPGRTFSQSATPTATQAVSPAVSPTAAPVQPPVSGVTAGVAAVGVTVGAAAGIAAKAAAVPPAAAQSRREPLPKRAAPSEDSVDLSLSGGDYSGEGTASEEGDDGLF